ncbi:MAG: carbamoyl phosphate synthase small subunit [Clostridia bacterium]|nr:carbamoyl phosphate synthase small subunit [Clostridia bacterium]
MKKAFLLLADGTLFEGQAVGHEGRSIAEIVFNTGMAGYQEVLTDPSYYGQTVCMTYPMIGNYGINFDDYESRKSWVSGFIMREICEHPSNWRCKLTLDEYLKSQKVVGMSGIDTRRLTRILRSSGVMNGILYTEGFEPTPADLEAMHAYVVKDAVKTVTCGENTVYPADGVQKYRIALYDYGVKYNMERELCRRGCEVTVVPGDTAPETVLAGGYDGVMLSNGPGDPAENVGIVEDLKVLRNSGIPIFGICLGHQLMSLAIGAQTTKLKYGHRGVNHPVKDLDEDRTYITSQNHGYAVLGETIDPAIARVRYVNLNDGTVEGVEHIDKPVFTVQYHPEVCPGPMDTSYLFDKFIENIEKSKGGAQ